MNISKNQRWILWIYTGLVLYLSIFHTPWASHSKYSGYHFQGYAPIWDESMSFHQIDYNRLIISIVVVTIVCGIIFLLCSEKNTPEKTKDESNSSTKLMPAKKEISQEKKDILINWLGGILIFSIVNPLFGHLQPKIYIPILLASTLYHGFRFFQKNESVDKTIKSLVESKPQEGTSEDPQDRLLHLHFQVSQIINEIDSDPDFKKNKTIQKTLVQFTLLGGGKSGLSLDDVEKIIQNQYELNLIDKSTYNKAFAKAKEIETAKRWQNKV